MGRSGVLSLVEKERLQFKVVVGCGGENLDKLSWLVSERSPLEPEALLDLCAVNGVGCRGCRVILYRTCFLHKGEYPVGLEYFMTLDDPAFCPRNMAGVADHVIVLSRDPLTGVVDWVFRKDSEP